MGIGLRLYYIIRTIPETGESFICLLGGSKNGQAKDIAKAKEIAKRFDE